MNAPIRNPYHPTYPADAPPVFFGHDWNSGDPAPEAPNAMCLDCSAGRRHLLMAYRWDRPDKLLKSNFVSQDVAEP